MRLSLIECINRMNDNKTFKFRDVNWQPKTHVKLSESGELLWNPGGCSEFETYRAPVMYLHCFNKLWYEEYKEKTRSA